MSHSYVIRPSGVTTRPSGPSSRRSSGMTAGLSGMARQALQAGGRDGLFDLPGVPRLQKLRDLAHALVGDRPLFLVVEDVPREVVVDVAVLEDLDEARAPMGGRALDRLLHVRDVAVDRPRDERRAAAEREGDRVHGTVGRAHRRRLRDLALLA